MGHNGADRYIEGKCPSCGSHAVGYQCDECSEIFEAEDLLEKKCIFCKSEPIKKETKHLFFALSKLETDVKRIYIRQNRWRENAQKITNRYLNEGFEYQAGNYFIIGTIAEGEGAINYMPDGNVYPGKVEATEVAF